MQSDVGWCGRLQISRLRRTGNAETSFTITVMGLTGGIKAKVVDDGILLAC